VIGNEENQDIDTNNSDLTREKGDNEEDQVNDVNSAGINTGEFIEEEELDKQNLANEIGKDKHSHISSD
jgi:hypothetical protein